MTPIKINVQPKQTGFPVWDFVDAIESQEQTFKTEQFYQFGSMFVKFYKVGNQLGADFYKPTPLKDDNTFRVSRVNTKNKRQEMGYATLNFEPT